MVETEGVDGAVGELAVGTVGFEGVVETGVPVGAAAGEAADQNKEIQVISSYTTTINLYQKCLKPLKFDSNWNELLGRAL